MEEKSHKPTPKRLRDARKRGEVAFSTDFSAGLTFVVVVVALWMLGTTLFGLIAELWRNATSESLLAQPEQRVVELLLHAGEVLFWVVIATAAIEGVAAFAGSFAQVGGIAAWSRLKPDVNRLNPAEGLKRIFSTRNAINLLKMTVKTLLLAALLFVVIRASLDAALKAGYGTPETVVRVGAAALLALFGWAGLIYLGMAGFDYAHQRYEYVKQLRMSIDDIRREHKETEGDPVNIGRRRSVHLETVYTSLVDRVRASSAVIHSPHVAVALQYLGEKDLPRVVARGEGDIAAQIRRVAGEASIPTEFESHLAQRLYEEVAEDRPIPRTLYEPVAKLLRWAQGGDANADRAQGEKT